MKIGILTTFYELNPSYSLSSVVEAQLRALVRHGYETVLFVHDNFKDDSSVPAGVEIRKIVPRFLLIDYAPNQAIGKELESQAEEVYKALKEHTKDIDVMFAHDLIFQGWFLPYAMAIHKIAPESKMKWLHWIHSNPSPAPAGIKYPHTCRYTLPINSKLVYLNNYNIVRVAETYQTFPKDVRIVYNPVDPRMFFDLHPFVSGLVDRYGLLEADFVQVYPVSTPRMVDGKNVKIVIDVFAKLKKLGKKVCLIIANAHANDRREKQTIAEIMSYAIEQGLNRTELIFTSLEESPKYEQGVSRSMVSQLFRLSNLFIFPSTSENCSLILLEAMVSKCLLVLNDSVPPMREFAKGNALYFKFGGMGETINYDNRDTYMMDIAKIIVSEFENNRALKASNDIRQNYNLDAIFKRQIEPLLYETM